MDVVAAVLLEVQIYLELVGAQARRTASAGGLLPNSTMPSDEARTTPMNRRQPSESRDVSRAALFLHALMERSFCFPCAP